VLPSGALLVTLNVRAYPKSGAPLGLIANSGKGETLKLIFPDLNRGGKPCFMVLTPDPCPSSPPSPHAMTGKESVSSSVRNLVTFHVMSGIPGANVIKHFTAVIYCCSMLIQ
jgi:hypothetical protein